jgi:hypothetical protein
LILFWKQGLYHALSQGHDRGTTMELLVDVILPFLGEFLIPLLFELLVEILGEAGGEALSEPLKIAKHPIVATIGFALWGAIAGGISLMLLPRSLIANQHLREIGLIAIPVSVSCVMAAIGQWRNQGERNRGTIARFGYPFTFALTMSLVRFLATR